MGNVCTSSVMKTRVRGDKFFFFFLLTVDLERPD